MAFISRMERQMKRELLMVLGATARMRDRLSAAFNIHELDKIGDHGAFLCEMGAKIEAVVSGGHLGVEQPVLDRLPNLKILSCFGVGYDAVDAVSLAKQGVMVTHTPDVLNDDVANTAIMLLLATTRNVVFNDAYIRAGHWKSMGNPPLTRSMQNAKIGILGLGRIGLATAERLNIFNAQVVYHSRSKKDVSYQYYSDLVTMARDVDALICTTPGGAENRHLVDRAVIDALGPRGYLINVSRGSVVDERALIAALQEARIAGAGLDVFEDEPNVPEALCALENVVLQPHIGSATHETRQAMGDLTCDNVLKFFETGAPLTPVQECIR